MKKYLDYILLGAGVLFGILSLALMAAPGVVADLGFLGKGDMSVFEVISNENSVEVGTVFALIFTLIAILVPIFLCVMKILKKKVSVEGYIAFCGALLAFVAGILFFCTKALVLDGEDDGGVLKLGAGAIVCGVFSLLNAITLCAYGLTKIKK